MAKQGISTGSSPNDGTGDSLLAGAVKVNENFDEVYGKLGDGTNLFVGIVSSIAVDGALSISTSFGAPTITGTANTAVINSRQIYSAGIVTFATDAKISGINTFSSAGYDIAGIITAQNAILYDTAKIAGITTINSFGVNVGGAVTANSLAVRDTGDGSYVGLNTVSIDNTGIAATAISITDTATLVTIQNSGTANLATANINSGIITSAVIGAGMTINSSGIDFASSTGIATISLLKGNVEGNVTGDVTGTASNATLAANAQGLQGTPNIVVASISCSGSALNANFTTGIATASAFKVGTNQVISSARQLQNIASLDTTTRDTIEAAIEAGPNDFTDINVSGLGTVGTLYVPGTVRGLNISGVTTGLTVSGVTTVGIVTGATSLQVTDVYSNFYFGDITNVSGKPTLSKAIIGTGVTIDQGNIDAGSYVGIITAKEFHGDGSNLTNVTSSATAITLADESSDTSCFPVFATGATGSLGPKTGTNLTFNSASGALTATSFVGALTGAVTGNADTATTATNVTLADESTDTSCNVLFATAATGNLPPKTGTNLTFNSNTGALTATSFVGALTGNVTGDASGSSGSCTGNAATATLATTAQALTAATINLNGNTLGLNLTGIQTGLNVTGVGTITTFGSTTATLTTANITTANVGSAVTSSSTGIVVGAGKSYTGDSSRVISGRWILGANGTSDYTFIGVGFTVTENDPDLYLARGNTYEFVNTAAHPFRIQSTANGSTGAAYGSGVINNDGSSGSTITFEVPFNAPDTLYYQCTSHTGMGGTIFIYPALR